MSMNLESGFDSVLGKREETDPWCGSDSVPGKRKEIDQCRSHLAEDEATGGENNEAIGDEKEGDAGGEKTCSEVCEICSKDDHWHLCCPWRVSVPMGTVPSVGATWMVACRLCGEVEFNSDEFKTCTSCGFCSKRVVLKMCSYCMGIGHLDKDCQYNLIEFTENFDPFNPPPGVQAVFKIY